MNIKPISNLDELEYTQLSASERYVEVSIQAIDQTYISKKSDIGRALNAIFSTLQTINEKIDNIEKKYATIAQLNKEINDLREELNTSIDEKLDNSGFVTLTGHQEILGEKEFRVPIKTSGIDNNGNEINTGTLTANEIQTSILDVDSNMHLMSDLQVDGTITSGNVAQLTAQAAFWA